MRIFSANFLSQYKYFILSLNRKYFFCDLTQNDSSYAFFLFKSNSIQSDWENSIYQSNEFFKCRENRSKMTYCYSLIFLTRTPCRTYFLRWQNLNRFRIELKNLDFEVFMVFMWTLLRNIFNAFGSLLGEFKLTCFIQILIYTTSVFPSVRKRQL